MQQEISFIVTGFGPFHDVQENPTTVLASKLVDYLRNQKQDADVESSENKVLASATKTQVFETSAVGAREQVDALYDSIIRNTRQNGEDKKEESKTSEEDDPTGKKKKNKITILLHLGVNYRGTQFQLETCAYNDATFRVPDERGYQPKNVCIVKDCPLKTPLETLLDVPALVQQMNDTLTNTTTTEVQTNEPAEQAPQDGESSDGVVKAVASTDPGRFVCNATYCYSLYKFQCSRARPLDDADSQQTAKEQQSPTTATTNNNNVRCLFLHVPPFKVAPELVQLRFVAQLMRALRQQVLATVRSGDVEDEVPNKRKRQE